MPMVIVLVDALGMFATVAELGQPAISGLLSARHPGTAPRTNPFRSMADRVPALALVAV